MIYIKNNTETQTIFIPRNELQKEAFVTSTKTYEDGYREGLEDGKEYQKDQLLNLYVTENGQYEREDGWGVVTVDVPIVECPDCSASYEEGYEIGKNEGYEDGFQDGYDQGQSDCPECDDCSGAYEEGYEIGKNKGYENGFEDGYEQGKSDCPECDECPELTSINITKNGSYEGAFKLVNVDVPNEGGSCKLTETSINLNKESATIIASNEGFDGYSKVTVTAWAYGDVRYAEGYEQGQADCPELTSINITENGIYEGAYNVVNVNIDTKASYNQGFADATSFDKIAMEIESDVVSKLEFLTDRSFVTTSGDNSPKSLMFDMPINYIWSYRDVTDGIAQLKQNAFRDYGSIRKVKLNTIMTLGERAFKDALELREIEMSALIGRIGTEAFDGCSKLAKIICRATGGVVLGSAPFNGLPENGVLYLKEGVDEAPWLEKLPSGWVVERI